MTKHGLVLLPGISRAMDAQAVGRGDPLILRTQRGAMIMSHIRGVVRSDRLPKGADPDALPILISAEFGKSDIPLGTRVYSGHPDTPEMKSRPEEQVRDRSRPPTEPRLLHPATWKDGFFHKKPSCPNCGSTELMMMEWLYPFDFRHSSSLKAPNYSGMWIVFAFPIVPLIVLQSPKRMRCDSCGADFIRVSRHVRIYRLLLVLAIAAYAWLIFG